MPARRCGSRNSFPMPDSGLKPSTRQRLYRRMQHLGITEDDFREKFILGSGSGGQKLNKTSSCVSLKHLPTGLEVKCQRSRSRELNRYYARCEICDKYEEKVLGEATERKRREEKIRRQKRRRSRRAKEKMLEKKRQNSEKKQMRRAVDPED